MYLQSKAIRPHYHHGGTSEERDLPSGLGGGWIVTSGRKGRCWTNGILRSSYDWNTLYILVSVYFKCVVSR